MGIRAIIGVPVFMGIRIISCICGSDQNCPVKSEHNFVKHLIYRHRTERLRETDTLISLTLAAYAAIPLS